MKSIAIFDIDGVIYDGHSIFDLIQDQENKGFIETGLWDSILEHLEKYKKGELTYKETADTMLLEYSSSLKGEKYDDVVDYNLDFIKRSSKKIFPYFKSLVSDLEKTHDIYFVTTNFDFTAEAFTKYFDLNGFLSSKVKQNNGVIQEGLELSLGGNKGIVTDLIDKYGFSGSIAVGDSENDIDMLEKVENPLVMEPDDKLKDIALSRKWTIVDRNTISDTIFAFLT
ncbi:MAG: haloacid dehalogenase-like hydrolase [bacterium]|nr:MAG: haloacid dehalogenase-like hydrolase [bacterium]